MALVSVLKYVFTFALGFFMFIFLGQLVYRTRYENPFWDDVPANILAFGDQMYGIWLLMIIIIPAVLIVAAWRESERKAAAG